LDNIGGEKIPEKKAFGGSQEWAFPPVFSQKERKSGVFSTGNEKKDFTGFSGWG
jgi:hypothetical protein